MGGKVFDKLKGLSTRGYQSDHVLRVNPWNATLHDLCTITVSLLPKVLVVFVSAWANSERLGWRAPKT